MHEESKNDDATNDEVLVIQSRSGDVSAFDELLERYQERLWRHALRLTNNEAAAWDILQETLLAIARGIGGLENETAFSAWAYRIVSHKSNDWLRRNIRRRDRESVFISRWLLEYQNVSPPSERFDRLCSAKAALNESERVLLSMRYDDGLGINEIADLLAVPEGTVKSRLHNIILKLRKLMEKKHEHQ